TQNAPAYFGGGVFWVEATDLGSARTRLAATALAGSGRASLEAVVEIHSQEPLFRSVLNSKDPLGMAASVVVDSYESALGSYASQVHSNYNGYAYAKRNGDVCSNQDIRFASGATVFGDATPGPGYSCSFSSSTYVSGSTQAATDVFSFPPIRVPPTPITGSLTVASNTNSTLAAGTYGFNDLLIDTGARLKVVGPAKIVCTNFTGAMNGRLEIDATNGPVTIYVQGAYTHVNRFEAVATPGSPMAVAFMLSSAQNISFPPKAKLRGAYYAPNANITFTNDDEIWGAFAGNSIGMAAGTRFHFDESLMDYWNNANGNGDPLEVLVWRRIGVTPHSLLLDHRDPYTVLGVQKNALMSPEQSWL
ncbi:MAG TPA: collagen-binding domain-containing protein, partial [Kofleriaceae bacterium]|nr:collagen-binding domain-containing protein [Kofleriaceae bacterium]